MGQPDTSRPWPVPFPLYSGRIYDAAIARTVGVTQSLWGAYSSLWSAIKGDHLPFARG